MVVLRTLGSDAASTANLARDTVAEKDASFPFFDWLRFFLASVVVLGHAQFQLFPFLTGALAVKVFFALSGFLIGGILLKTEVQELARFFFNRATRIWIPYFVAIVLLYSVAAVKEGIDFFWFKYLILDLTFTHQLYMFFPEAFFELPMDGSGNQFWSLSVEEQFYLIAPLIMLFAPLGKSLWVWLVIALLTSTLNWDAGAVSIGVCAAILHKEVGFEFGSNVRALALSAAVISAFAMSILEDEYIFGVIFAISVVVAVSITGKRSGLSQFVGGISFPLYLNHWLAAFAANYIQKHWLVLPQALHLTLYYSIAIVVAVALYWLVDRNVRILRASWYSSAFGLRLGLAAYALVCTGIVVGGLMQAYGPHGNVPEAYAEQRPEIVQPGGGL